MKEVFISYSTVDTVQAETVRNVLEKNGLSCWMAPRDIPGGSNYSKEIPVAIRNCKIFVLVLSKNAQSSHWVLKELDSAVNAGKVILPFMVEDCALNDEFNFLLTGAQRYAAYQKKAEAMEILIGRLRSIVGTVESAPAEEPVPQPVQKKAAVYFTEAVCTACGSSDLTPLPKRVKYRNIKEMAALLYAPAMGIACGAVAFFIFDSLWLFELLLIMPPIAFFGGCV
jgi:hypothetical protein